MKHSAYCRDPDCPLCRKQPEEGSYTPNAYGGSFKFQGVNDPAPPPLTGRHHTTIITDDLTEDAQMALCNYACRKCEHPYCAIRNRVKKDDSHRPAVPDCGCSFCRAIRRTKKKLSQKSNKEVNMSEDEGTKDFEYQELYEVVTTYGADRDNVIVKKTEVVAENENRALMQSKDDIDSDWDMDYVEQSVIHVCNVRVKRKPREILKG